MKRIIDFLRLIRSLNLAFIALTQYLIQYTIIIPLLNRVGQQPTLDDLHFFLLVLSTVLVAAAGYVINDYFDLRIDEVNKPRRIFIERAVPRRLAMILHQGMTGLGVLIAIYLAWQVNDLKLAFIHPTVAALLWFYSTGYKRRALVGNSIVSLLTALVVLIVGLYERKLFTPEVIDSGVSSTVFVLLFGYFIFAFLISMIRELVKDMEDLRGDMQYGCRTLPIVIGVEKTKWVVYAIAVIALCGLLFIQSLEVKGNDHLSALNILITVEFPLLAAMAMLARAKVRRHFTLISSLIKVVMLTGILTMLYFYLLMQQGMK